LIRFLGEMPKDQFVASPVVLFSPRHDPRLLDQARALGLTVVVYRPTGVQMLDQLLLYFVHLPIRALISRRSECLLNLGDYIVPFTNRQVYYFDWLYAVTEATDVWKQMTSLQRINRKIKRANIRSLIKTPRVVIVQSHFVARQMTQMLGRSAPSVIPCPVEEVPLSDRHLEAITLGHEVQSHQFFCLSSFATHKNVEILLAVAEILKKRRVRFRIVLTLDDSDQDVSGFLKRISESGLSEHIVNAGVLNFEDIDAWFVACDALLLPTKLESFGLPYVESLARGRPILTSDLPFAHEACKTGTLFFDPDDPLDIANTIEDFIQGCAAPIDEAIVSKIVEDSRPDRVYAEILSQTWFK
jgi:glycosyltransferase involved in cell wall biosynthesis